jgi:hypothetical protein
MAVTLHPVGLVFGLGAVVVGGLVLADHQRKRQLALQQQLALRQQFERDATRARLIVVTASNGIADMLSVPRPLILFDRCANAETNTINTICVSTSWALQELAASCRDAICVRDRIFGTIAHEFGHILDPYVRTRSHKWHDEFAADYTSGWIMRRMGADPAHFINVLERFYGSDTHPPPALRQAKVWEGYNNPGSFEFNWV